MDGAGQPSGMDIWDPPQYVAARVQRAIAEDERTNELGIKVDIRGDQLFLRGQVCEGDQRERVAEVAAEAAPGLIVHNEVICIAVGEPGEQEML